MVKWSLFGNTILGENDNDRFGHSVSLSNTGCVLAVGAPKNRNRREHIRVYDFVLTQDENDTDKWKQRGDDIEGTEVGEESGSAVALLSDGNTVAIRAPHNVPSRGTTRFKWIEMNGNSSELILMATPRRTNLAFRLTCPKMVMSWRSAHQKRRKGELRVISGLVTTGRYVPLMARPGPL
jgi:hypothetical protein